MDLYFSPLACSMATRIALYEAGADAAYLEVDPKTKRVLRDDSDFYPINPLGLVPTLRTDDGLILIRERRYPAVRRRPFSGSTHRIGQRPRPHSPASMAVFHRHRTAQGAVRTVAGPQGASGGQILCARQKSVTACPHLDRHLDGPRIPARSFQRGRRLPRHGVELEHGDAMIDFSAYPHVQDYLGRMRQRPSIARAMAEELELFKAETTRHKRA